MNDTGCDSSSPSVDSHYQQSTHCDDSFQAHHHYGTVDLPVSSTCDSSSPSDYSQGHQSPRSNNNFQDQGHDNQGYSHHHGSTVLPVSSTTNGGTGFDVAASGRPYIILIVFGLLPAIIGIALLSQATYWKQNRDPVFIQNGSPNPFEISGSVFLSFGLLLILGALCGICCARRRLQQQILVNTLVARPAPVVSGQLNLPYQTAFPPQLQNGNSGQPPFNDPPPPYWSKDTPPPTYRY